MKPQISIIIPVYNEAETINQNLESLVNVRGVLECEIIIVDGHPDATTLKAITSDTVIKLSSLKGRGRQMNAGAERASGSILLFLHADTTLPANALELIHGCVLEKNISAGAFQLHIDPETPVFKLIAKTINLRCRFTRTPYGDQAVFLTKTYFKEIGGYKPLPLFEDVELMQRIKKRKDKIYIIPETVSTSARRWQEEGVFYCTLRNWLIISLYYLGVSPGKLAKLYKDTRRRRLK